MKIIVCLMYLVILVVTIALCKSAKRADEDMEKYIHDAEKKNT